jgi:hypothetical protein
MGLMSIGRSDGRSNTQVVVDLVAGSPAETVFTYDEIGAVLAEGTDTSYDKSRVAQVVRDANTKLLKKHSTELVCVRNVGYAIAPAKQHLTLSDTRRAKAGRQLKRAALTLRHVRESELDPNTRAVLTAHRLILGAVMSAVESIEARQAEQEEAMKKALHGIDERLSRAGL